MSISWHESRTSNFMLCFFIAKILGKLTKIEGFLIFWHVVARCGTNLVYLVIFGRVGASGRVMVPSYMKDYQNARRGAWF